MRYKNRRHDCRNPSATVTPYTILSPFHFFTFSPFHLFTFSSIAFGLHESCHSTTGVPSALNVIGSQM